MKKWKSKVSILLCMALTAAVFMQTPMDAQARESLKNDAVMNIRQINEFHDKMNRIKGNFTSHNYDALTAYTLYDEATGAETATGYYGELSINDQSWFEINNNTGTRVGTVTLSKSNYVDPGSTSYKVQTTIVPERGWYIGYDELNNASTLYGFSGGIFMAFYSKVAGYYTDMENHGQWDLGVSIPFGQNTTDIPSQISLMSTMGATDKSRVYTTRCLTKTDQCYQEEVSYPLLTAEKGDQYYLNYHLGYINDYQFYFYQLDSEGNQINQYYISSRTAYSNLTSQYMITVGYAPKAPVKIVHDPSLPADASVTGWTAIGDRLEQLANEKVPSGTSKILEVNMNGTTVISKDILQRLAGKDVHLVLHMGELISWSIYGKDLTDVNLTDIDGGVTRTAGALPADVINQVTGASESVQVSINHNGTFGFNMRMDINLDKENAGKYANLYYYNPTTRGMEFQSSSKIGTDGNSSFVYGHASDYAIYISDEPMGADTDELDDVPKTGDTTSALPYVSFVFAIAFIGAGMFYVKKKQKFIQK